MLRNRFYVALGLLAAFSMILGACAAPAPAPTTQPAAQATSAPTQPTAAPAQPTSAPAQPTAASAQPTEAAKPTEAPAQSTRHGGWLDEIDYSVVDGQSAITQIQADAINLFSYGLASDKLADIKKADLCYTQSYGTYYSLLFNPYGNAKHEYADGRLNPFSNRKIREATNWAVDRNYINQEIYAGGALPKLFPLTTQLVDYTDLIAEARGLEAKYAYNLDKAKEIVDTEMTAMGAKKGADGKWEYNGKPVKITFLIRNDGDGTRLQLGNYFGTQLEAMGFAVEHKEGKSSDLSPLWIGSDPKEGQWDIYTGGWGSNGLNRDERTIFREMYLPNSPQGIPLFTDNVPDPEFQKVGDDLADGRFKTLQERHDLMVKALPLSVQDSLQVWLVDLQSYAPFNCDLEVSSDVGAGVETTFMSPYTMRFKDKEGGQVKVGTTATLFTDPWNPVNGANWVTSAYVQNATAGRGTMPDPYTGLAWPLRAEKADLVAQTGTPVQTNLDWVNLSFEDTIKVPDDAWVDWDPVNQKFLTAADAAKAKTQYDQVKAKADELVGAVALAKLDDAALVKLVTDLAAAYNTASGATVDVTKALTSDEGKQAVADKVKEIQELKTDDEKKAALAEFAMAQVGAQDTGYVFTLGQRDVSTAKSKAVIYYPADMFKTVKWHDGSALSPADFIMSMILTFDYGKPGSAIYDEDVAGNLEAFLSHFKGVQILSTDPLTIATYDDNVFSDAELNITTWWPNYGFGEAPWQSVAIGNEAVAAKELAWGTGQADRNKVEWMSFIGGPSLDILSKHLDQAIANKTIPYADVMGKYVTADEAVARYNALKKWYADHKHFWDGTGPYYLSTADLNAGVAVSKQNPDFVDLSDRWSKFGQAPLGEAALDGPAQLKVGEAAEYKATFTYQASGDAYPTKDIRAVKFLLYDSTGATVYVGAGTPTSDEGVFTLAIPADVAAKLTAGAGRIEVAGVFIPVAIPAFTSQDYVVLP